MERPSTCVNWTVSSSCSPGFFNPQNTSTSQTLPQNPLASQIHVKMRTSLLHLSTLAGLLQTGMALAIASRAVGESETVPADLIMKEGGFLLPDGPDGIFSITLNANSTEATITTIELFDDTKTSKRSSSSSSSVHVEPRALPIASWGCMASRHNSNDYDQVTRAFGRFCDDGWKIPGANPGILYTRVGSSIAYGCSYGGVNPCSSGEFYQSDVFLDSKCRQYMGGWIWMPDWAKGYGRVLAGELACGVQIF